MPSRKLRLALLQAAVCLSQAVQHSVDAKEADITELLGSIDESLAKIRHAAGLAEPTDWHLVKLL